MKVENTLEDYIIEEISEPQEEIDVKKEQREPKKEQPQIEDSDITESESSDDPDVGIIANPKKYVLKTYKCPVCNLKFGGKKTFESHECNTDDPTCNICGKKMKDVKGKSWS